MKERAYFLTGVTAAAGILYLGRDLLPNSIIVTWSLTFAGTTLVAVLAAALYRVRLELRASRHELARNEAELNFALQVQRALFPRVVPSDQGLEIAAVCIPARGISGDYYDVISLPDGRLIMAVADISGKGISAAMVMSNLQAMLRLLARSGAGPAEVCAQLNRHLYEVTEEDRFATLFYTQWEPQKQRLCYVNAGHNLPIFLSAGSAAPLDHGGFPVGMFPETRFETGEIHPGPGDLLAIYSDGIVERGQRSGHEFGQQRLQEMLFQARDRPLREVQDRVISRVRHWSRGEAEDDMTLMLVRIRRESTR